MYFPATARPFAHYSSDDMMNEDPRPYFLTIINTLAMVLIWMITQVIVGIYMGFGFFGERKTWQHIVYYIFFLATLAWLARYVIRKWKKYL